MVALQDTSENFLFAVDYHAITVPQDPEELRKNLLFATATYLAAGIDPEKTVLFQQSQVTQHTELGWVLNCLTYMGELERMTQFKDKALGKGESVSIGLFDYPVLMAADILLYDTEVVPVGHDQKQHLELARDLAQRFNKRFGETFVVPKPQIRKTGARIMALDNPENKMSKSAESAKSYISLMDDEKTVLKKIKSAVTDSEGTIKFSPERPAVANLITIYSLVTGKTTIEIESDYEGKGYGDFKVDLAAHITSYLTPLQDKISAYMAEPDKLKAVLEQGAEKASKLAEAKMKDVRQKIGVTL
jgi:tryptophanyl-tRNA synthetase